MANPTEKAALGRLRLRSDLLAGARAPTVQWMRIDSQRLGYFSAVDIGYVGLHREAVYRGGI
jgi:hypothetical protein